MFAFIKGEAMLLADGMVIIFAGGIGYEVNVSRRQQIQQGATVSLYLQLMHKEDSMTLYGFESREEKRLFLTLLSAQGVGAKLAMETLSTYSVNELFEILFTRDISRLKKISGMGAKKAEKLLFDLRDKIDKTDIKSIEHGNYSSVESDALKALVSLGFSTAEASTALSKIEDKQSLSAEALIGRALRGMSSL